MSLLFAGQTQCPLCTRVIEKGDRVAALPVFVWNQADPLALFSDASLHADCFLAHPLRERVEAAIEVTSDKVGPGHRKCAVCAVEVTNPDDYFMVPRLSSTDQATLGRFDFTHLHRAHILEWPHLEALVEEIATLVGTGAWKGGVLNALLLELKQAVTDGTSS